MTGAAPTVAVVIIGPGAVGCLVAAELIGAGTSVTLLDHRTDRAQRLTAQGLVVEREGVVDRVPVRATADPNAVSGAQMTLVTVKSPATRTVAGMLAGRLRVGTIVVTLQNGLGNAQLLRKALPAVRVVQGLAYFGSRLLGEGHVAATPGGRLVVGGADASALQQVETVFAPTRIRLERADDIERELWLKTMVNGIINPLTAIYRLRNGELPAHPQARRQAQELLREAVAVAAAAGHPFHPAEVQRVVWETCRATAANVSSMRQDVEAGRTTEIEAINGAFVRLGAEKGVPTPHHAALADRIRRLTSRTNSRNR